MDPVASATVVQPAPSNGAAGHAPQALLDAQPVRTPLAPMPAPQVPPKRVIGRPFQKGHTLSRGRPAGSLNKRTKEIRDLARRLLEDKPYQKALQRRLREGTAQHVEQLLYHYAYGKPADRVKITGALGFDLVSALQRVWQLRGEDPRKLAGNGGRPALAAASGDQ